MSWSGWSEFKKTVNHMSNDILRDILKHYDETLKASEKVQFQKDDLNNLRRKKEIVLNELARRY